MFSEGYKETSGMKRVKQQVVAHEIEHFLFSPFENFWSPIISLCHMSVT